MDVQSLEMAPLLDLFGPDAHHLGRTGHDDAGQLLSFNDALNSSQADDGLPRARGRYENRGSAGAYSLDGV